MNLRDILDTNHLCRLADRAKPVRPSRVLETAAAAGIVTQELVRRFSSDVTITATDLNQPMIDHARAKPA